MDRRSLALGFLGYLCIGIAATLIPSLMPSIIAEFTGRGWSLAAIGILVPAGAAGSIGGNLLAGFGSDRLGRRRLTVLAAAVLAAALVLTASAQPWVVFVLGFVAVSMAQGSLSTGINAMIAEAGRGAPARVLNMLHGTYGLGAAISPLVIGWALGLGVPWRSALIGVGVLWLSYAILVRVFSRRDAPSAPDTTTAPAERKRRWDSSMLRHPSFVALFGVAFVYNGIAASLLAWVAVYAQRTVQMPEASAIALVSVFYFALTAGRFICAFVSERLGYARTLIVLALGVLVSYPAIVWGNHAYAIGIGMFVLGLSLSGLFPTVLADAARRFTAQTGSAMGTLSTALTLGSLIPPLWTSRLAATDLTLALGINYAMAFVLLGFAVYLQTHGVGDGA